ncbi:MAG: hypothetical protein HY026_02595 [Deltaproteobacteria bacterium]|nr:hypothetical protein [Deltaproteobacteria bacterium]
MALEEVPIYPGGILMSEQWNEDYKKSGFYGIQEEFDGLTLSKRSVKVYGVKTDSDDIRSVQAVFEELKKFYWGNLGGKPFRDTGLPDSIKLPDYSKLKSGTTTNINFGYDHWGFPVFLWVKKEINGDITLLWIYMIDAKGIGHFPGGIMVIIGADTYSKNVAIKIPDEAELGAPLYPGVVYNPRESVGSGIMITHVFYSNDTAEKIVKFYEQYTGTTPLIGEPTNGGKSYLFQGYSKKNRDNWIAVIDNKESSQGKIRIEFVLVQ